MHLIKVNFHDIVSASISTDHPQVYDFFVAEYQKHLVEELPEDLPSVDLQFRLNQKTSALRPEYTQHSHKALARWFYRLELSKNAIKIDVSGNRFALPMVHHMLLHHSLRYLAAHHGVLMLHAGAVARDGKSLLFTGYGGTGKTTTTSLVLASREAGWSLHADDYIFLASGPKSLAYMTRAHLYRDLIRWVPDLRKRLTPGERLRLGLFGRIRDWSRDSIKWPVRLSAEQMWPDRSIETTAVPVAMILLERADVSGPTLVALEETEDQAEKLLAMNFYEARHFLMLVEKNRAVPDFRKWLAEWQMREGELLRNHLRATPVYTLKLPSRPIAPVALQDALLEQLSALFRKKVDSNVSFPA